MLLQPERLAIAVQIALLILILNPGDKVIILIIEILQLILDIPEPVLWRKRGFKQPVILVHRLQILHQIRRIIVVMETFMKSAHRIRREVLPIPLYVQLAHLVHIGQLVLVLVAQQTHRALERLVLHRQLVIHHNRQQVAQHVKVEASADEEHAPRNEQQRTLNIAPPLLEIGRLPLINKRVTEHEAKAVDHRQNEIRIRRAQQFVAKDAKL
mmetsp:Transcript_25238/g.40132  ORF Transcript_25238/g.40132 Transcript_25238/m.40132 type:complete len:212 (+) Transcript_25238:262-897(+)